MYCLRSGGQKPETKVLAGPALFPSAGLFPQLLLVLWLIGAELQSSLAVVPVCMSVSRFPLFYKDTSPAALGAHPLWYDLILMNYPEWPYFQIRSQSKVLGIQNFSIWILRGHKSTHNRSLGPVSNGEILPAKPSLGFWESAARLQLQSIRNEISTHGGGWGLGGWGWGWGVGRER